MRVRVLPPGWQQPEIIGTYVIYLVERELDDSTVDNYKGIINRLAYWLDANHGIELLEADTEVLRHWRHTIKRAPVTVRHYLIVVQGFYLWAQRSELIPRDPAWSIPRPRLKARVPRPITEDRLQLLLEVATGMLRLWMVLGAYCGLRAIEIAGLRWENLYDGRQPYVVVLGKGNRERAVPISPFVWSELMLWGRRRSGPIFRRVDGLAYTSAHLDAMANTWLHESGFWETMHMLRHRFGTAGALATGGDLVTVGTAMGHANPNTTKGYTLVGNARMRAMVCAIQPPGWDGAMDLVDLI